jgi:apolipoprotein D and lipocalin family protein
VKSKGFPNKTTNNLTWKVQFVWPFKADYLIEELADDYSYVVVGHPKKKFLYIMNRTGKINEIKYNETLKRYQQKGYDISKLKKLNQSI